jgi:hypothetical protein
MRATVSLGRLLASPGVRVAIALAGCAALAAVVFLTPPSVLQSMDYHRFHEPMHGLTVRALRQGRLPLWNPYVNLGRPHLADLQAGVFYPTSLLYLLAPLPIAFFLTAVLHLALGSWGLRRLAGILGAPSARSWLPAMALFFAGSVASTLQTGSIECLQAIAYLPVVLWMAVRLQEQPGAGRVAGLAGLLALQLLCGHPQYSWITALGAGLFLLGRRLEWPPRQIQVRAALADQARLALAGLLALAIDGIQLLPFFELASRGNRGQPSIAFADAWSMPWVDWATLVRPVSRWFVVNWVDHLYLGVVVTLAGVGALARLRDRNVRGLVLMATVALLIGAGTRTPLFALAYHLVPGVSMFRLHARMALLVALALALGAALLASRPAEHRGGPAVAVIVAAVAGVMVVVGIELRLPASQREWAGVLVQVGLLAGAAALIVAWTRIGRAGLAAALAALALIDIGRATVQMKRVYQFPHVFVAEQGLPETLRASGLLTAGAPPPRIAFPYPYVRENAGCCSATAPSRATSRSRSTASGPQCTAAWASIPRRCSTPFPRTRSTSGVRFRLPP